MLLPSGAIVAVADGEKLSLFHNSGDETHPKLVAMPAAEVDSDNKGSSAGHQSSSANPDGGQAEEDGFAVGIANMLNRQVLSGAIKNLVIVAAPKTLGHLRKHYHKTLSAALLAEVAKDLTGHGVRDIEKAVAAA